MQTPTTHDPEKRARVLALIELLAERFPKCFAVYQARRRPLKLGIHKDVVAVLDIDAAALSEALRCYVSASGYLYQCRVGAPRIDLNGEAAGEVTAGEAVASQARLDHIRTLKARRREAHQPPKRLSLADLKAAAQRRKAGVS
jgi:ProP effector